MDDLESFDSRSFVTRMLGLGKTMAMSALLPNSRLLQESSVIVN
jgi:hypothetical protein